MARKVSISKDVILEAALKMLIRDGYSIMQIKKIQLRQALRPQLTLLNI